MTADVASAPLGRRLAAVAYDALLLSALVLVAGFLTLPLLPPASAGAAALRIPDLPARTLAFAVVFATVAAYCTWFWSGGRRTLAMKTWRLALVRADGGRVGFRAAFVRYLAGWIGPAAALGAYVVLRRHGLGAHAAWLVALNFLWAFADPGRRFLHDRIAGTVVVADAPARV